MEYPNSRQPRGIGMSPDSYAFPLNMAYTLVQGVRLLFDPGPRIRAYMEHPLESGKSSILCDSIPCVYRQYYAGVSFVVSCIIIVFRPY